MFRITWDLMSRKAYAVRNLYDNLAVQFCAIRILRARQSYYTVLYKQVITRLNLCVSVC